MSPTRLRELRGFHDAKVDSINIDYLNRKPRVDIHDFYAYLIGDGMTGFPDEAKGAITFEDFSNLTVTMAPHAPADDISISTIWARPEADAFTFSIMLSPLTHISGYAKRLLITEPVIATDTSPS